MSGEVWGWTILAAVFVGVNVGLLWMGKTTTGDSWRTSVLILLGAWGATAVIAGSIMVGTYLITGGS